MNTPIYSHSSLTPNQIRLMHLVPGSYNDTIVCSLRNVQHPPINQYEALSYVWGDEIDRRQISIHGYIFSITPSLELALRHLRHASHERVIWIDQICIDQKNHEEKAAQVNLMGQIYRNASDVIIWLGNQTMVSSEPRIVQEFTSNECERALKLVSILSTDGHLEEWECFEISDENRLRPKKKFMASFNALRRLMHMAWWKRIWTVQEIVLARSANVLIGTQSIRWEWLEKATLNIREHRNTCCLWLYGTLPQEIREILDQFYLPILGLVRRRYRPRDHISDLIQDLQKFRHRQSKNPLDKVYGLLGLHPHMQDFVDYSRPWVQVYVDVMMQTIVEENDLRALVDEKVVGKENKDLLSWVVDWRAPADHNRLQIRLNKYFAYNSSKDIVTSAKLVNGSLLQLSGFRVDEVSTVEYAEVFSRGSDVYPALDKFREHLHGYFSPDDLYITGGTFAAAFWRTTLGNRVRTSTGGLSGYRSIIEDDVQLYQAFCSARRASSSEDLFHRIHQTVEHSLYNRAFFLTAQGYMGIGPRTTKVGDEICIILGSNVPFVTRNFVDIGAKPRESLDFGSLHYHLVGDCYVHGIMEGEAMDQPGRHITPIVLN